MKYLIDYEYGTAELYTPSEHWLHRFTELSDQCFRNKKSVGRVQLIEETNERPPYLLQGEHERLCYNGDVVVWNKEGVKIKSEWD